ncbi:MAG: low molecular weight phosphotyrosine protein phosphatase, partial [Myxococcota bacterium]|nr:low molecular weight phosphotyrosine protein phosphatase [Myxococcota bacterium]
EGLSLAMRVPSIWDWLRMGRTENGRLNLRYELNRIFRGPPEVPQTVSKVLVICHGNICRSPFAEILLQTIEPGLSVRSAGLAASGRDPAEPAAIRVASEFGIDLSEHRSTRLTQSEVEWADLILGMEGQHIASVDKRWRLQAANVLTVGDFLERAPHLIPDPWGQSDAFFAAVFEQIRKGITALSGLLKQDNSSC